MSPKAKHVPDGARQTTVYLTVADEEAVSWIRGVRRGRGEDRTRLNDILVDSLWFYLENVEKRTREQILAAIPVAPFTESAQGKVTQMPKRGRKR